MDGFKKYLSESVQFKLSLLLSLTILFTALVAGIFSFVSAFDEAHELQDDTLYQVAELFNRQHIPPAYFPDNRNKGSDEESLVILQNMADNSQTVRKALTLPSTLTDGLHTLEVNGKQFRVLVKTTLIGDRIAVAQETSVRDEIAYDSALRTLMPFLILLPILLLIVAKLVRKIFRPIASLSAEIDQRAEQALHPIEDGHLPSEVRPFVVAINRLLARVGESMEAQRRFIADAAHELRSPLTALSLQAERLAQSDMPDLAQERLTVLRRGIERNRKLLDQLLALAKAQAAPEQVKSSVSVQHIYRYVLEDLLPLAEAKHIDIGVEGEQDAQLRVNEQDLITVVKNIVDNAIRYTPDGGRVDLSVVVEDGYVVLRIQDSGPGIKLAERERVFDPFYRILGSNQTGSGLGLSIAKVIADRMGADIQLGFTDKEKCFGLCVFVRMAL